MKKLYFGGPILTMDDRCPRAEALLEQDGRIAAVGDFSALAAAAPDAARADLGGAALLPAFTDPHSHFTQVASGFLQADLTGADSLAELSRRISALAAKKPSGWLLAQNFEPSLLPEGRPTLAALDRLSGGRPLVLQYTSGHMALFSSAALREAGISDDTPDPAGGRIGRADGRPDGYLEETACFSAVRRAPFPTQAELLEGYRQAQALYFENGITTFQDGMFVAEMVPLYQALLASGLLRGELEAYAAPDALKAAKQAFPGCFGGCERHLRFAGLKIFLDGSPQGRTAWMRAPYEGSSGYCSRGVMTDEAVLDALELSAREGLQLLAHCNGDAAAEQFLRCLAKSEARFPVLRELRPVLIHAQLIGLDQLPRVRELGAMCSFFPAHVWHWGDVHIRNFGLARASEISPAASALGEGLPVTFHQDSPVIEPDMIETLWCAVSRRTKSGVLLGPDERVSVSDALAAVTRTAAYQYFEEREKGTLEAGKRADLMILSADPLKTPPEDLRKIRVLRTVKGGETVFTA